MWDSPKKSIVLTFINQRYISSCCDTTLSRVTTRRCHPESWVETTRGYLYTLPVSTRCRPAASLTPSYLLRPQLRVYPINFNINECSWRWVSSWYPCYELGNKLRNFYRISFLTMWIFYRISIKSVCLAAIAKTIETTFPAKVFRLVSVLWGKGKRLKTCR